MIEDAFAVPPIPGDSELERLVNRSRLIGADPTLVVHGGGNTSSKIQEVDQQGRERTVLRIKGSGTDLKTIGADGFPGLWLDELLPLRERAAMSDEAMVAHLAECMVEPGSRRPSIETLLHAFLPARHVDHVHADAICALTNTPDAAHHVREALGPDVALVPYTRPGFALSRQVSERSGASAVVLDKHGLVTWGETHEESYGRTLELVARAEAYLAARERPRRAVRPALDADATETLLLTLRGLLSADGRRVLHLDRDQQQFADRPDAALVATAARATPDHVLRIGAKSLLLPDPDPAAIAEAVAAFAEAYRAYFARHQQRLPAGLEMLSPLPRVVLVPGLGAIAAGGDARTARVNAEVAARSHLVTARTLDAFGAVAWLDEEAIFDFDYWPLELYKLQSAPAPRALAGQVVIVSGADGEQGRAVAARLAQEGAHLVLVGADTDALGKIAASLAPGTANVPGAGADPVAAAIAAFGGVDCLIALERITPEEQARFARAERRQGLGGTIIGLQTGTGTGTEADAGLTVERQPPRGDDLRVEIVRADAAEMAEAMALLAAQRTATESG